MAVNGFRRRVARLEQIQAAQRGHGACVLCRERPAVVAVWIDGDGGSVNERRGQETRPPCGCPPVVVRIREADDWETVRRVTR